MEAIVSYPTAAAKPAQPKHRLERNNTIKTDLFNRFAIILAVKELKLWRVQNEETVIVTLQVYPGEPCENRFLRREIKKRLQQRFNINATIIELDW